MTKPEIAVKLLKNAGYEAVSNASHAVIVQDPVQCSAGSRKWVESREVSINIGRGLEGVYRFINERE